MCFCAGSRIRAEKRPIGAFEAMIEQKGKRQAIDTFWNSVRSKRLWRLARPLLRNGMEIEEIHLNKSLSMVL